MRIGTPEPKPLKWVGSSKDNLLDFPDAIRKEMGHALYLAQISMKAPKAKPLRGFGVPGFWKLSRTAAAIPNRTVYTVKFRGMVFVLHAFQKKSKRGIQTPKADIEVIKTRLKFAADLYDEFYRSENR